MRRLAAVVLLTLVPVTLRATVLVPIEFRELVAASTVIVRGRVVSAQAEWVDGRRAIETIVTIEPFEYLRGDLGERLTLTVPGGQLGRYRTVFVGAPVFGEGDEVVLFLAAEGAAQPHIVGLSQGVFRVVTDQRSGRVLVTPPAVMAPPGGDAVPVVRGDPSRRAVTFDAFRNAVRQVLATSQAARR